MVLDEATSSVESCLTSGCIGPVFPAFCFQDEQTDALIKNLLQAHWSRGHAAVIDARYSKVRIVLSHPVCKVITGVLSSLSPTA